MHLTPAVSTPRLQLGSWCAGKYRVDALLGAGAFGAVYSVYHAAARRQRALKVLHPHVRQDAGVLQHFLLEARAAGRVHDEHLVEIIDAGTLPSGVDYELMELLQGETLEALCEREHVLDSALACELVAQAAQGVAAIHEAGILHGDIKPANLFVTQRAGAPFVKLLDFGSSSFLDVSLASAAVHCGSPAYMAPEQLQRVAPDQRADVYSLGVTLYECLSHTLPFAAPTVPGMIARIVTGNATRLHTLCPALPRALADVIHQAIEVDRDHRYPDARSFSEALAPRRTAERAAARAEPTAGVRDRSRAMRTLVRARLHA